MSTEEQKDCKCRRIGDYWNGIHHPLCDANWSGNATPASIADTAGAACVDCQENCQTCTMYKAADSNRTKAFDEFCNEHIDGQDTVSREWLWNFVNRWFADTAGAKAVARVSYRVEADGDTYSFFEWLGDVPPQGTLLYTAKVPSLDDAQIQRLWVIANTKRVPEFIESTRALLAAPPAPSVADAAGASEDARDAARYRWLVENCFDWAAPGDGDSFDHIELHFESDMLSRDDESVGRAIDSAIAKESGK